MRNQAYLTRPCTDYRLATSSKSLLSEEVAVEQEVITLMAEMEEWEGKEATEEEVVVARDMVAAEEVAELL